MVNAFHNSLADYGRLISDDQQFLVPTLADVLELFTSKPREATFQSHLYEKTKVKTVQNFMDSIQIQDNLHGLTPFVKRIISEVVG